MQMGTPGATKPPAGAAKSDQPLLGSAMDTAQKAAKAGKVKSIKLKIKMKDKSK